ncbi:hypothetical protein BUZ00_12355 [Staphylococcus gallinarum]|nr:hypothetical protein BUZ00_12355 [Staphylococcus gallinarum]PTK89400.1 hypothetical protein BUZ03_11255 [Staphylococcus gallinarum]RIL18783.1 hypothetical protein BUY99_13060 [Staphylococcus gallinarum]RIL20568.1 hypothetical protein BUY97_13080 [Staphylococcus gallinarum]RIL28799.1 hypothetical protein BUY95_06860 [Staphylococcus gallinarum]
MYILFEHIEDYESPQVNIITINKNINEIMKFLSEKNINHSLIVDNQQIFYCNNKNYILITKETNNFMKQEVIA